MKDEEEEKDDELIVLKVNGNQVFLGFAEDHDYVVSVLTDVLLTMLRQNQDDAYDIFSRVLCNVFAQKDMDERLGEFFLRLVKMPAKIAHSKPNDKAQAALAYYLMNTEEQ